MFLGLEIRFGKLKVFFEFVLRVDVGDRFFLLFWEIRRSRERWKILFLEFCWVG